MYIQRHREDNRGKFGALSVRNWTKFRTKFFLTEYFARPGSRGFSNQLTNGAAVSPFPRWRSARNWPQELLAPVRERLGYLAKSEKHSRRHVHFPIQTPP